MTRQFVRQFRVRQQTVRDWLIFLKGNHPGYQHISIDESRLSQLPLNGDVFPQVLTEYAPAVDIEDSIEEGELADIEDIDASALPNLLAEQAELEVFRDELEHRDLPEVMPLQPANPLAPSYAPNTGTLAQPYIWVIT